MGNIELIYCAKGNRRFSEIARAAGFSLGAQLPGTIYFPIVFADQDWKRPNRAAYMAALAQHKPRMASVLDLEREDQLGDVLSWAEEAAQWCERVMLIPKAQRSIPRLPRRIGGADVVLGYSVPTRHGGTAIWSEEFNGWPIHLLGGSPQAQMRCAARMRGVISADGNMANRQATKFCAYWVPGTARGEKDRYWPKVERTFGHDATYEAFRRSCENIMAAWKGGMEARIL